MYALYGILSWELLWDHLNEQAVAQALRTAVTEQLADTSALRLPIIITEKIRD